MNFDKATMKVLDILFDKVRFFDKMFYKFFIIIDTVINTITNYYFD